MEQSELNHKKRNDKEQNALVSYTVSAKLQSSKSTTFCSRQQPSGRFHWQRKSFWRKRETPTWLMCQLLILIYRGRTVPSWRESRQWSGIEPGTFPSRAQHSSPCYHTHPRDPPSPKWTHLPQSSRYSPFQPDTTHGHLPHQTFQGSVRCSPRVSIPSIQSPP